MYAFACAALPFINLIPLSTYLFIAAGIVLLITGNISISARNSNLLFWLFLSFYILQAIGYFIQPNADNLFALEQKASLLFIPVLITSLIRYDAMICRQGIKAFIAGNVMACVCCWAAALFHYSHHPAFSYFFYHQLSATVGANAIYASLYIVVSVLYLLHFYTKGLWKISPWLLFIFLATLIVTLLFLSSKMIIVTGIVLILSFLFNVSNKQLKLFTIISVTALSGLIALTNNPIKNRFEDWNFRKSNYVLKAHNFTNYPFDDFDLRILLIRLGYELTDENTTWLFGNIGLSYHRPLNEKMHSYKLFAGNEITKDTGYINYNMHNQYLENFIQYGFVGLLVLIFILVTSFATALKSKNKLLSLLTTLFFFSFLSESVLETQAGILLFTLIVYYEWNFTKQRISQPIIRQE